MAEESTALKTYYYSTEDEPFKVITSPDTITPRYPITDVAPDSSLKSPKFDWGTSKWVELDPDNQAQLISALQDQVKSLTDQLATSQKQLTVQTGMVATLTKQLATLTAASQETTDKTDGGAE